MEDERIIPNVGEVWFVQLPGELIVDEVYVLDVSDKTCRVRDTLKMHKENRYKLDEVKWVEQSDRPFRSA